MIVVRRIPANRRRDFPRWDVMKKTSALKLEKFPAAKQRRLDALLEKNSEGTITPAERAKLEQLVAEAELLTVTNAQRLAKFSKRAGARHPANAVPVTVWVQAEHSA